MGRSQTCYVAGSVRVPQFTCPCSCAGSVRVSLQFTCLFTCAGSVRVSLQITCLCTCAGSVRVPPVHVSVYMCWVCPCLPVHVSVHMCWACPRVPPVHVSVHMCWVCSCVPPVHVSAHVLGLSVCPSSSRVCAHVVVGLSMSLQFTCLLIVSFELMSRAIWLNESILQFWILKCGMETFGRVFLCSVGCKTTKWCLRGNLIQFPVWYGLKGTHSS
jgi:hypothetical protein